MMDFVEGIKYAYVVSLALIAGVIGGYFGAGVGDEGGFCGSCESGEIVEERVYVEDSEIIDAIEKVSPAVVSIVEKEEKEVSFFESFLPEAGGGTGFIVSQDGYIFTNKHVVPSDEKAYKAVFSDGSEYDVSVVSKDPFDDIAVLKLTDSDGKVFSFQARSDSEVHNKQDRPAVRTDTFVKFGDSDKLKVGQKVFVIGNSLAMYGNSVTSGIISAKGREVYAYNDFGGSFQNFYGLIQTDAAINLGNSGGPVVNLKGEVVGMSVATAEFADNVGFAIPANDLKPVLESIKEYGKILRPVLGVRFLMLSPADAKELNLPVDYGAVLVSGQFIDQPAVAKGSAGYKAGLKEMDVILEVDGVKVSLTNPLQKIIRNYKPEEKVGLKVFRDGKEMVIDVVLEGSG